MDATIISFIIGVVSSLLAVFSSRFIKSFLSRRKPEEEHYLISSKGETREIVIEPGSSENDIKDYISSAIEYEKLVKHILQSISPDIRIQEASRHDKGYDFVVEDNSHKMLVEAKATKRPVGVDTLARIISSATRDTTDAVIISKSGFSSSVFELANERMKSGSPRISLISGDQLEEITVQIRKAIGKEGITSKST